MSAGSPTARERILQAATAIAKEQGTAHMSLEAVAARAGVSKGGLLYHFANKAKLLEAIVEEHVSAMRTTISEAAASDATRSNSSARAYVDAFRLECAHKAPPPSGILAAIAENPGFIDPIRRFQREIVDRFREECTDPRAAIAVFLAIEGIRCLDLLDAQVLAPGEYGPVLQYLKSLL